MAAVEPVLDQTAAERARLVNEHRANLLRSGRAVTLAMLAQGQSKHLEAARQWARRQRRDGRLIYVIHNGAVFVPTFQLDEAFALHPTASETISTLTRRGLSDWAVWTWFESSSPWLGGRTPAEAVRAGDRGGVRRALRGLLQE